MIPSSSSSHEYTQPQLRTTAAATLPSNVGFVSSGEILSSLEEGEEGNHSEEDGGGEEEEEEEDFLIIETSSTVPSSSTTIVTESSSSSHYDTSLNDHNNDVTNSSTQLSNNPSFFENIPIHMITSRLNEVEELLKATAHQVSQHQHTFSASLPFDVEPPAVHKTPASSLFYLDTKGNLDGPTTTATTAIPSSRVTSASFKNRHYTNDHTTLWQQEYHPYRYDSSTNKRHCSFSSTSRTHDSSIVKRQRYSVDEAEEGEMPTEEKNYSNSNSSLSSEHRTESFGSSVSATLAEVIENNEQRNRCDALKNKISRSVNIQPHRNVLVCSSSSNEDSDLEELDVEIGKRLFTFSDEQKQKANNEITNNKINDQEQRSLTDSISLHLFPTAEEKSDDSSDASLITNIIYSVASLHADEIERQSHWALWSLQERLGPAFPSCLKPVSEPSLKNRPLQSLRYIQSPTVSVPTDYWSSKQDLRQDNNNDDSVLVSPEALLSFKAMFSYPGQFPELVPSCKLCGSPSCWRGNTARSKCKAVRCARCCRPGHVAGYCYKKDAHAWENRFLYFLNSAYKRSIENHMLRQRGDFCTEKRNDETDSHITQFNFHCTTCFNGGHIVCSEYLQKKNPPSYNRFVMTLRSEIMDYLMHYKGRFLDIRWDRDASPSQDVPLATVPRYVAVPANTNNNRCYSSSSPNQNFRCHREQYPRSQPLYHLPPPPHSDSYHDSSSYVRSSSSNNSSHSNSHHQTISFDERRVRRSYQWMSYA